MPLPTPTPVRRQAPDPLTFALVNPWPSSSTTDTAPTVYSDATTPYSEGSTRYYFLGFLAAFVVVFALFAGFVVVTRRRFFAARQHHLAMREALREAQRREEESKERPVWVERCVCEVGRVQAGVVESKWGSVMEQQHQHQSSPHAMTRTATAAPSRNDSTPSSSDMHSEKTQTRRRRASQRTALLRVSVSSLFTLYNMGSAETPVPGGEPLLETEAQIMVLVSMPSPERARRGAKAQQTDPWEAGAYELGVARAPLRGWVAPGADRVSGESGVLKVEGVGVPDA
ncbi:hypothetical protein H0H81_003192 [Sphagnurus paluster]|uniref:Uncharacterized protein n=1 Tax=Sphagnurus paluster TaxID=117069 RepID=A0A9P7K6D8_9AGAR|nr:hypothetical protein H0H81_003192 [Sphagnurus paluster]